MGPSSLPNSTLNEITSLSLLADAKQNEPLVTAQMTGHKVAIKTEKNATLSPPSPAYHLLLPSVPENMGGSTQISYEALTERSPLSKHYSSRYIRERSFTLKSLQLTPREGNGNSHTKSDFSSTLPEDYIKKMAFETFRLENFPQLSVQQKEEITYAKELMHFYFCQSNEEVRQGVLLCHSWFLPTSLFLFFLVEQALQTGITADQGLIFMQVVHKILSQPHFYCVDSSSLFDLYDYVKNFPGQGEWQEIKSKLSCAIYSSLVRRKISASTMRPQRDASQTATPSTKMLFSSEATPCKFDEIKIKIQKNKVTSKILQNLATDLKKLEASFFTKIRSYEFPAFKQNPKTRKAQHIRAYIQYTNALIQLVDMQILCCATPQGRARQCEFYIQLIKYSLNIGNFNGAHSLLCALDLCAISRLGHTWKKVSEKSSKDLASIRELFSLLNNFQRYYLKLQEWEEKNKQISAENCIIPCFVTYLKNFTFIDDGNSNHSTEGNLNVEKIRLLS